MLSFRWLEPFSLQEALQNLQKNGEAVFYAGGTDLLPLMNQGLRKPGACISLKRIRQLGQVRFDAAGLRVGSMVTLSALAQNPDVREHFPALAAAAGKVASPQIRNTGTVGGNLLQERRCRYFNRSPRWRAGLDPCFLLGGNQCYQASASKSCRALYYSDLATALAAYDARVEIVDQNGTRATDLDDLFNHDGERNLAGGLLTAVFLPLHHGGRAVFYKDSIRDALDFPVANVAVHYIAKNAAGKSRLSIVAGALAPYPLRLVDTEREFALGCSLSTEKIAELAVLELKKKHAIVSEVESTPGDKLKRAQGILKKALVQVFA
jgi:4-hydroxybenzoyl-CoA reductase beta subunit